MLTSSNISHQVLGWCRTWDWERQWGITSLWCSSMTNPYICEGQQDEITVAPEEGTFQHDGICLMCSCLAFYLALTMIPTLSSQLMCAKFCFLWYNRNKIDSQGVGKTTSCCLVLVQEDSTTIWTFDHVCKTGTSYSLHCASSDTLFACIQILECASKLSGKTVAYWCASEQFYNNNIHMAAKTNGLDLTHMFIFNMACWSGVVRALCVYKINHSWK